ncbi:hypothetical protein OIU84_022167 [Salix udensis]|uniref:Uncharacterized protein n=1 Tax=Salix udensis TaxID=889485 RepID=A0AAD6KQ84_9ROSI|nr:hypothetical protein OIU84_022167 [Salix udensis]
MGCPFGTGASGLVLTLLSWHFDAFQQLSRVSVRPMTSISSMADMHEDICTTAERKRAAMIILPFHKQQRLDGSLETARTDFQLVNRRVLGDAPCSVGILVDRGLGGTTQVIRFLVKPEAGGEISGADIGDSSSTILGSLDEDFISEFKQKISRDDSVKFEEKSVGNAAETIDAIHEVHHCNLFLVGRLPDGEFSFGFK